MEWRCAWCTLANSAEVTQCICGYRRPRDALRRSYDDGVVSTPTSTVAPTDPGIAYERGREPPGSAPALKRARARGASVSNGKRKRETRQQGDIRGGMVEALLDVAEVHGGWSCKRCTFINAAEVSACAACDQVRLGSRASSRGSVYVYHEPNGTNSLDAAALSPPRSAQTAASLRQMPQSPRKSRTPTSFPGPAISTGLSDASVAFPGMPVEDQAGKAGLPPPPAGWICGRCTLRNDETATRCLTCDKPQPRSPACITQTLTFEGPLAGSLKESPTQRSLGVVAHDGRDEPPGWLARAGRRALLRPKKEKRQPLPLKMERPMEPLCSSLGVKDEPKLTWECQTCTLENSADEVSCRVCQRLRPRNLATSRTTATVLRHPETPVDASGHAQDSRWSCESCTVVNDAENVLCVVCNRHRPRQALLKAAEIRNAERASRQLPRSPRPPPPPRFFTLEYLAARKLLNEAGQIVKRCKTGHEICRETLFGVEGFRRPVVIENPVGLDMVLPPKCEFDVEYVMDKVGRLRQVDVIDVAAQREVVWTMHKWVNYFRKKTRPESYNIISLEFSDSPLAEEVEAPKVVRNLDWIDTVYPALLKKATLDEYRKAAISDEAVLIHNRYPKVQKYCLMGTQASYTNFHVDFGGSSVWYHILKGRKIFFVVPPTPENLYKYKAWSNGGRQNSSFFGDEVDNCFVVELHENNTLLLPSGWIHSVWTPEDSLVFGGNFLHGYDIGMLLTIDGIERDSNVHSKYRLPFFEHLLWYALDHYLGVVDARLCGNTSVSLSDWEVEGLQRLADHLSAADSVSCPETLDRHVLLNRLIEALPKLRTECQSNPHPSRAIDYGAVRSGGRVSSLSRLVGLKKMLLPRS